MSYTGGLSEVVELAHELGHGTHALLAAGQPTIGYVPPPVLAEAAAVFGELATLEHLLAEVPQHEINRRRLLLTMRIDAAVTNVFRSTALLHFEEQLHSQRRQGNVLSTGRMSELWISEQRAWLGEAVELSDGFATWWSSMRQFVATPGSFLAYPFGWVLASSLHERLRRGDPDVTQQLEWLLRAGGSAPAEAIARQAGCQIHDPEFWRTGLDALERDITELEAL
jgi:oligoendopeptidase F